MIKKSRKWLVRSLDAICSKIVRNRQPKCEFCGAPSECAFHYITRSKFSIRWDIEFNIVASCFSCNYRMEFDPAKFYLHFIIKNGLPAFDDLVSRGNGIAKHSNQDLQDKLDELNSVFATMKPGL